MKKILSLVLSLALCGAIFAGCSAPSAPAPSPSPAPAPSDKAPKVALILEGPISDMSWNATAYNGLMEIEKMGAEVSFQENVPVPSLADSIATYANDGYDLIYLSTSTYADAGMEAAKDFPNTKFILINGKENTENITSLQIADEEQGFMMGVVSALISKSKQVGFVGAMEITPIINGSKGFVQGAQYVNNGVTVKTVFTGSFDDVNKAKETAKAMIDSGIDVVAPMADQAGLGVVEAAEEGKVMAVASGIGLDKVAPTALANAVVKDNAVAYVASYKAYLDGTLSDDVLKVGAKDGVVYLTEWFPGRTDITDDVKAQVKTIYDDLVAGKITINLN